MSSEEDPKQRRGRGSGGHGGVDGGVGARTEPIPLFDTSPLARSSSMSEEPVVRGEMAIERLVALGALQSFGYRRLWSAVASQHPDRFWENLRLGRSEHSIRSTEVQRRMWSQQLAATDVSGLYARQLEVGPVTAFGDSAHPVCQIRDPFVPPVLYWATGLDAEDRRSCRAAVGMVAIVGTRRPTGSGIRLAREFGAGLTAAGVGVISGLALGIDGAAHRGALEQSALHSNPAPLAVVGSGVDRPYPRQHAELWAAVEAQGAIVSEYPSGTPPAAWRFPERNRVMVGLSDLILVVESHESGGSLVTANLAADGGESVMAVPGPVLSPASVGTNRLLADGCAPCLCIDDVLTALELVRGSISSRAVAVNRPSAQGLDRVVEPRRPDRSTAATSVCAALDWYPCSIASIVDQVPLPITEVLAGIAELEAEGTVLVQSGYITRLG